MATVKICDRCGKTYIQNCKIHNGNIDFTILIQHPTYFTRKYDLCDDCLDKLYYFLNNNQDK